MGMGGGMVLSPVFGVHLNLVFSLKPLHSNVIPPDYEKIPNFSKDRGFQNCINSLGATW